MKRTALYARYSTDMQNERSVEDQLELCRAYAVREGLSVVSRFSDKARSGGSMFERDGLLALLAQAQSPQRPFDVLVVEALDRLSRDMEDLAGIHKRLTFHGVEIRAVHEGVASTVLVGLRGLVGQLFREDGAKKIKRGLSGVVRSGRIAGGLAYGYRVVPGRPGEREIDPGQSQIVLRVFEEYAAGSVPRRIAAALNHEGIAPPRGILWNASTLNGSSARGNGMLNNEHYVGRIVWNKVSKARNPYTGRRVPRVNPTVERETTEVPALRIIEQDLWDAVQAMRAKRSKAHPHHSRRPQHLLSGLLRCGCCGSGYTVHDRDKTGKVRIRCSAHRESGSCENRRIIYLPAVEAAVIDGMRTHLRDPRMIEVFVKRYNAERRRLASTADRDRAKIEARLEACRREYDRLLQAFTKGILSDADAEALLPQLREERARLETELSAIEGSPQVIALHPTLVADYLRHVEALRETLSDYGRHEGEAGETLVASFRALVETVTIHPGAPRQGFEVEVRGRLSELIGEPAFPDGRISGGLMVPQVRTSQSPTMPDLAFVFRARAA